MNRRIREARERDEGFTLIELLIVIVILGILAAIVVFSVSGITDRGEASAEAANVETVNIASEAFRATHANCGAACATPNYDEDGNGYADSLDDLAAAGFLKTLPGTPSQTNPDAPGMGETIAFEVMPAGGTGYEVTYDRGTGSAASTNTPGGGGGTTTTTTAPPTLSIIVTSPAAGPVSGTVNLVASGTLVTSVQFQVDGVNVGAVDSTAPFEATWDTTTATNAAHNITAIANGGALTSAPVAVTVNNAAAVTIAIATPGAGNVNGTVNLTANVTGSVGNVEYFYGATSIGTSGSAPYTVAWNTALLANGPYVLTAVADGTVTSAPVNVTVNNACAYVSHTAPATLDIDMDGSNDGDLLSAATFSFQTTGACTAPMSIRITRPSGVNIDVTPMSPNTPSTGPATWSFMIPANSNTWDNFGSTIGTGSFVFRSNGVQIPGSPTANINFSSTNRPCARTSASWTPVDGSGDVDIDVSSGGSGNPARGTITNGAAISFTVVTTGNCVNLVLTFDVPGNSPDFASLTLSAPAASITGGTRTWTSPSLVNATGWGDGSPGTDRDIDFNNGLPSINGVVDFN